MSRFESSKSNDSIESRTTTDVEVDDGWSVCKPKKGKKYKPSNVSLEGSCATPSSPSAASTSSRSSTSSISYNARRTPNPDYKPPEYHEVYLKESGFKSRDEYTDVSVSNNPYSFTTEDFYQAFIPEQSSRNRIDAKYEARSFKNAVRAIVSNDNAANLSESMAIRKLNKLLSEVDRKPLTESSKTLVKIKVLVKMLHQCAKTDFISLFDYTFNYLVRTFGCDSSHIYHCTDDNYALIQVAIWNLSRSVTKRITESCDVDIEILNHKGESIDSMLTEKKKGKMSFEDNANWDACSSYLAQARAVKSQSVADDLQVLSI